MKIKYNLLIINFLLLCLLSPLGVASHSHLAKQNVANQAWFTQDPYHKENIQLRVDLFLSSTCPHCLAANQFFHQLESKKKWLSVHRYYVNQDKAALDRFNDLIQAQQITINAFAVPAIFFCDSRWLGFDNENNSGHQLLKSLNYCHQQLVASGKLTPTTVNAIRKSGVSEWYESNIVNSSSWVELIVSLAVFDAFMPCSFLGFLAMFAFLYWIPQRNVRLILSGFFLITIGAIHYLQQAHTVLFYELIQTFRWPTMLVGIVLLGVLVSAYRQRHLPRLQFNVTLQGMMLSAMAVLTVAGVYSYHQECLPNYALVFQNYLATQSLSPQVQFLYVVCYQLVYLLALALLLVIVFLGLARLKKHQKVVQHLVFFALLFFAGFLMIYPAWLN